MRKLLLFVLLSTLSTAINAQTVVLSENMETIDSLISSGNPTWFQSSAYQTSGSFSIRDTVASADSSYLTSVPFSTVGNLFVILNFNHICKIAFNDFGTVEVSSDNGASWIQLTAAQYLGTSGFSANSVFNSVAYPPTWIPGQDTATPQPSWFKSESFDVSALIGNVPQARIRFKLKDGTGNGNTRNFGWVIDDVVVNASPQELNPPTITYTNPIYQGQVYNLGPYTINCDITDATGVNNANLYYSINGGPYTQVIMTNPGGANWQGVIPTVADSDTVCYYVEAFDSNPVPNSAQNPLLGCTNFVATSGITFPFFDNFDAANLWTPNTVSGSAWQLGTPSFGATNSSNSAPNSWDIELAAVYAANTEAELLSPIFDFSSTANNLLTVWINHNCEGGWDGTRIDYTTDGGATWNILGTFNDPLGTNWYNEDDINSSNEDAWAGSSNGWIKATYKLVPLNFVAGAVQFKFVFTSDGSVQTDGFTIDDFSITLAPANDVGVSAITRPLTPVNAGISDSVKVTITNFGGNTVTSTPVTYDAGAGPVTEVWNGSLAANSSVQYTFNTLLTIPSGNYTLCAYTGNPLDTVHVNDTTCIQRYGTPQLDAAVTAILNTPISSPAGVARNLSVTVRNLGIQPLTTFDVNYSIAGGPSVTETFNGNLNPNTSATFNFTTPYIVPTSGYEICSWTSLAGDGNNQNDTSCKSSFGLGSLALPYTDDYETTIYWYDSSAAGTNWQLGLPNYGLTNSTHSGINAWDVNLNTVYGNNANSYLLSSYFDFTTPQSARLSFWHNFNSEGSWDGTRLEYTSDSGATWQILGPSLTDPAATNWYTDDELNSSLTYAWEGNSNGWIESTYKLFDLNAISAGVRFRFVFESDGSVQTDGYSIDDFTLTPGPQFDVAVVDILNPSQLAPAGIAATPNVVIQNQGRTTVSNFNITYTVNGTPTSFTYIPSITPGQLDTVSLPTYTTALGQFDFCAFTELASDLDRTNDTLCVESFGVPVRTVPYYTSFDTTNEFANPINLTSGFTNWEFGTPGSSIINVPYSAPNAWKTVLVGDYSLDADDYLYSPFFDFTAGYFTTLKFRHWYETEDQADGGRVEYSLDEGATWSVLGIQNDTNGTNWYTEDNLFSSNLPGFEGSSQTYIESSYELSTVGLNGYNSGLVQFRFNISSDGFGTDNGWAIDNFELSSNIPPLSASPSAVGVVPNPFVIVSPVAVSGTLKNTGGIPLNSVNATLVIDGVNVVTDLVTFTPPLTNGNTRVHTFSQPWNVTPGGHDICIITSQPNGATDLFPVDDTLCFVAGKFDSLGVNVTNSEYCNDFDGTAPRWIPLNAYNYEVSRTQFYEGSPTKLIVNSNYSGTKSWIVDRDSTYNLVDSSGLFSPVFEVDSSDCYEVSFWHNFNTELYQDGGTIEYSINSGQTWNQIGYAFETDWYNSPYITGLFGAPRPGWSGNSNGWIKSLHNLKFPGLRNCIFRFRFGSDYTVQKDGWAIDNFCFRKVGPCVIGLTEIADNGMVLFQNVPNPAANTTTINYSIPTSGNVTLTVTNMLGQIMFTESQLLLPSGMHSTTINTATFADGIYMYTLNFNESKLVRKMMIAK
ncbi:MAG: hypothetical protein RIQ89_403 [Bacteroidota bacterium]